MSMTTTAQPMEDTRMNDPVLATTRWANNAHLVADVARLGYLRRGDLTLDATYGRGGWWTRWRPDRLVTLDQRPGAGLVGDFRCLPFTTGTFDAVAFDPPYKLNGTPGGEVDARYGVDVVATRQDRHSRIRAGLVECSRVLRPTGHLLLKCQDQISSGHPRWQSFEFTTYATTLGLELVDRFDMLGGRPQPLGRRQVHARRNTSQLLIFKKPNTSTRCPRPSPPGEQHDAIDPDALARLIEAAAATVTGDGLHPVRRAPTPQWRVRAVLPSGDVWAFAADSEDDAHAQAARMKNSSCVVEHRLVSAWAPRPGGSGADEGGRH